MRFGPNSILFVASSGQGKSTYKGVLIQEAINQTPYRDYEDFTMLKKEHDRDHIRARQSVTYSGEATSVIRELHHYHSRYAGWQYHSHELINPGTVPNNDIIDMRIRGLLQRGEDMVDVRMTFDEYDDLRRILPVTFTDGRFVDRSYLYEFFPQLFYSEYDLSLNVAEWAGAISALTPDHPSYSVDVSYEHQAVMNLQSLENFENFSRRIKYIVYLCTPNIVHDQLHAERQFYKGGNLERGTTLGEIMHVDDAYVLKEIFPHAEFFPVLNTGMFDEDINYSHLRHFFQSIVSGSPDQIRQYKGEDLSKFLAKAHEETIAAYQQYQQRLRQKLEETGIYGFIDFTMHPNRIITRIRKPRHFYKAA